MDSRVLGAGLMDAAGIGKNHCVLAILVFEKVKDAVLLHEPRDKIEIGFAILDAVFAGVISGGKRQFVVVEAPTLEDFFNDLGDGLILKDAAVGDASEEPKPGYDLHLIVGEALVGAALRKAADEAVEVARGVVCLGDSNRDLLTDDVLKGDGVLVRSQVQMKGEEAGNAFASGEALQEEDILAEGGINGNQPILLCVGHTFTPGAIGTRSGTRHSHGCVNASSMNRLNAHPRRCYRVLQLTVALLPCAPDS